MQSPEVQSKIAMWRAKADTGQMTQEEWLECFTALRADRRGALATSNKPKRQSKAAAAKAPVDLNALKNSLRSLGSPQPAASTGTPPVVQAQRPVAAPSAAGGPPRIGPPKI